MLFPEKDEPVWEDLISFKFKSIESLPFKKLKEDWLETGRNYWLGKLEEIVLNWYECIPLKLIISLVNESRH